MGTALYGFQRDGQWLTQGGHYLAEAEADVNLVLSLIPDATVTPLTNIPDLDEAGTVSWTHRWLDAHRAWLAATNQPSPESRVLGATLRMSDPPVSP